MTWKRQRDESSDEECVKLKNWDSHDLGTRTLQLLMNAKQRPPVAGSCQACQGSKGGTGSCSYCSRTVICVDCAGTCRSCAQLCCSVCSTKIYSAVTNVYCLDCARIHS